MHTLVMIIQMVALCYQYSCVGIVVYGTIHEGTISEDDIYKFTVRNLVCFGIILLSILSYLI